MKSRSSPLQGPTFSAYMRALCGNLMCLARQFTGLNKPQHWPILSQPLSFILERHAWICSILRDRLPPTHLWSGLPVCEAGAGDCLAGASMALGLGASHVTIVEHQAPSEGEKQSAVLTELRRLGYPCSLEILRDDGTLNHGKCTYVRKYMEAHEGDGSCSLVYSVCVGEHVENLSAFFLSCKKALRVGGYMTHYIDLGGHGIFEDPMPPLEFHRYSDFAYSAIYPRYKRATRRFVSDYKRAARDAGFGNIQVEPVRVADPEYVKNLRPYLRSRARGISDDELRTVEFVLNATLSSI